ncbi:putative SOS response-associated peptidase YedK [Bacillus pakistanensis]|uniref:Abasic site processing protein n=1 Tax=Rossellomorea pakistanensis TaxID=992288 RepID=A0ABS2N8Q9_9BACI|nr:SOS response-associated peptidase [Bacillus pakistanensis]MBM7584252.1 putative SOS response-associated peptidase YedK [Bacillus pakistanensis]
MCGRYTLTTPIDQLMEEFMIDQMVEEWGIRYNIAPSQSILTMIQNGKSRRAGPTKWGLTPFWVKNKKRFTPLINARSETIGEKPSFKHLINKNRAVIMADSFYEWKQENGEKLPIRFTLENGEPFVFAALWDKQTEDGEVTITSTILTTEANELVQPVHKRMPVILTNKEDIAAWLETDNYSFNDASKVLQPYDHYKMKSYPVSKVVNSPSNDSISCIQRMS